MVAGRRSLACCAFFLAANTAFAQAVDPERSDTTRESAAPVSDEAKKHALAEQEARQAFQEGLRHLRAEQWVQAEVLFRRSHALVPRQSTTYNLALVLFKQRRPRESLSLLEALLKADKTASTDQAAETARYREYGEALLPHVLAQVSTLELSINAPDAQVWVDGQLVSKKGARWVTVLDPGGHRVEVSAVAFQRADLQLVLQRGERHERHVELSPLNDRPATRASARGATAPTPAGESQASTIGSVGPWVVIGLGTALLGGGIVTGILAKQADDEFVQACPELQDCDPGLQDDRQKALRLGTITDVLLVSGGVVAAGGVAWLVFRAPWDGRRSAMVGAGARF